MRVESILLRGLKWSRLIDPDKKGQWWLSGDLVSATNNIVNVARKIDRESSEVQKMLQLAAGQRMNTDARRAIFCIIMSGEDYIDAFEKLLRLDLQGKQVTIYVLLLEVAKWADQVVGIWSNGFGAGSERIIMNLSFILEVAK